MKTSSQNKIKNFWNWFQDNHQTIYNLQTETPKNRKHINFWMQKHLNYYSTGISFIITFQKRPKKGATLIITANGNPAYFRVVTDLIDNAPVIKNWTFQAFIKPTEDLELVMDELDEPFIINDITIKASEAKFLPFNCDEKGDKFDILVFLKNYDIHCKTDNWTQAIYIIMQLLFGEKFIYQSINFVQLAQETDEETEALQLCLLENYIDIFRSEYGEE